MNAVRVAQALHALADAILEEDASQKPRARTLGGPQAVADPAGPAALDWIDQFASPLGKRKHNNLCKAGTFPSAHKEGHRWLVRRGELDAYVTTHGKPPKKAALADLERDLEELGFVPEGVQ